MAEAPAPTPVTAPDLADALTLDQMRVFVAVVDEGSFSAAARALRRAQSAVSYAVANLERQLGVTLFDRTSRTPALRPAGKELVTQARVVLAQVDRMRAQARVMTQGIEASLSLAVDHLFPLPTLTCALSAFRTEFPTVGLTLHTEALGAVVDLVLRGTCSIGIGTPLPHWPDTIERRPILPVAMVMVAAPTHPLARRRGVLPGHVVREHVQIVLGDRSRLTEGIQFGVFADRIWRVLDLSAKLAILRAGLGWGGMPLHVVEEDLRRKRLVRLRLAELGEGKSEAMIYAIHRTADPPGPAAQWLLERLSTPPGPAR